MEADWLFRKMVRKFIKERDKVEVQGIALPSLLVLQKIYHEGPQRLGDLAEELDFTSGAVTGLCDKLEKKALARRIRRGDDRRSVWLDITSEGRTFVQRNRNVGARGITLLFGDMTEAELAHIHRIFKLLIDRVEQYSATLNLLADGNGEAAAEENNYRQGKYLSY